MCPQKVAVYSGCIGHHHVKSSFGANNNSYEYYLGVFSCCQYLELYLRSKILGNLVSGDIINWLVVLCHLPQDGFENHPFSLFSSHSSSGTFGMRCWIKGIRKVSFNLGPECDEYIQIFEYSNILVTNIYSDIHSYKFFFHEYIRTFVRVKFVCTNTFGHSLVSVLECKTETNIRIYSNIRAIFNTNTYLDIRLCQTN